MRLSAYDRFQRQLRLLLKARKEAGDGAAKGKLADYCGKSASWVSNFLEPRSERPRLDLEDLENIADFFRVSVSELFRPANPKNLSADEQRVLLAFRSVPQPIQDHFLALLEMASLQQMSATRRQTVTTKTLTTRPTESRGAPSLPPSDAATELQTIRRELTHLSQRLAHLASGAGLRAGLVEALREQPHGRDVAP